MTRQESCDAVVVGACIVGAAIALRLYLAGDDGADAVRVTVVTWR